MRSKKELENELLSIKRQLSELAATKASEKGSLEKHATGEQEHADTGSQMFSLLKYMIDENKRTTMLLSSMMQKIDRIENELNEPLVDEEEQNQEQKSQDKMVRQLAVSGIDARIIQFLQLAPHSMACADDVMRGMGYKGRNAACARLNKLYRMGLIDRFQLGHKVYYKYDAGKATNILIVSPPQ
ncbi:hypothetical protein M1373_00475 [Candidatus Marsarchaeota archaeon]|nr:hypothetical protein [Candidatus Marsarchaeota archaeon]MCL5405097.1 hypothetical protein [Candidatus Marsarchaeota archaeon]